MSDQIRTVLAGFDGTEGSEPGLRLGATIARTLKARLVIAAVVDYETLTPTLAPVPAVPVARYEELRQRQLEQIFARVREILGPMPFERRELAGSAARALNDCAIDDGADLIVLGATHHGLLGRVFPGSVGQKLLNGAPCPVAVAPAGWAAERIGSVRVGFDGGEESRAALRTAASVAAAARASLELLTVLPTHLVLGGRLLDDEEMRGWYRDHLDEAVAQLPGHAPSGCLLEHGGGVAETLRAVCDPHDLLVIGSRGFGPLGRVLLGSISAKLLIGPACPVIVVPRPDAAADRQPEETTSVAAA